MSALDFDRSVQCSNCLHVKSEHWTGGASCGIEGCACARFADPRQPGDPTPSPEPTLLLAAVVAALPELQRQGVRRLTVGPLTVELDRVQIASDDVGDDGGDTPARNIEPGETLPPQPEPGESDDLDTAAVDG